MSPLAFDTLSASKQLREAGMSEGVAEAVVSVFQHAATMPDISHLATKADLEAHRLATKGDLEALQLDVAAIRSDMATKAELEAFRGETQAEFKMVRLEIKGSADGATAAKRPRASGDMGRFIPGGWGQFRLPHADGSQPRA